MKGTRIILLLTLISVLNAQRFSQDFGLYEWRKKLLNKPVGLKKLPSSAYLVVFEGGFNYISSQGTNLHSKSVDWKKYYLNDKESVIQFLTRDNQVQEFSVENGDFRDNIPVTDGEEIVDVNVSDDTVQLLRRDSFEVINARGKATRFEVQGGEIVEGYLSRDGEAMSALVLFSSGNEICAERVESSDDITFDKVNCIEAEDYSVVESNEKVFVVQSGGSLYALSESENAQIGDAGASLLLNLATVAVQQQSGGVTIFSLGDLQSPEAVQLPPHCVMNRVFGVLEDRGLTVACHNYKGETWQQKTTGVIKVELFVYNSQEDSEKIGEFNLTNLGDFRYTQEMWVETDQTGQITSPQAIKFDDLSLRLFSKTGKQLIKFESGLTQVKSITAENLNDEKSLTEDPMHTYLALKDVPIQGLIWRFLQDIDSIREFIFNTLASLQNLQSLDLESLKNLILKPGYQIDLDYLNKYGLRKRLILLSEANVIYSLDSQGGDIFWVHYPNPGYEVLRVIRGAERGTLEYHYKVARNGKTSTMIQIISAETGEGLGEPTLAYFQGDSKVYRVEGEKRIEIDYHDQKIYSTSDKNLFTFGVSDEGVSGYNIHSMKIQEIWNIKFSAQESLIDYSYHLKDFGDYFKAVDQGFFVQIPEENSLLYKIVDSHNLAVVTRLRVNGADTLNVYIINGRRGKIMAKYQNPDVDFTKNVNLVYDDNGIFISYFNKKLSNTEIWVIEVLKNEVESDFLEVVKKFITKSVEVKPIDYSNMEEDYIILERKYGAHFGIKKLSPIVTKNGLTRRNLIAITDNNDIYSLDRLFLSARRLTFIDNKPPTDRIGSEVFMSASLPPYQYFLPYTDKNILNAHLKLDNANGIKVFATEFESTSLVLVYGGEMFFTRIHPDGIFDMLKSDFNYILLGIAVVAIAVGVYILRLVSLQKEAKAKFYTS